jgi:dTDP-4-amino-4,6-dideoxygalactose transaminase
MADERRPGGCAVAVDGSVGAEAIPFLDLVAQHASLEDELVRVFRAALRTAEFVGGPELLGFEQEFAAFVGAGEAVGVSSGTDALRFAYLALSVRPGDEVITVPYTFIATAEAITQAGARVRFVDIDEATMTMDPQAAEAAVTARTVGIVPVHLYGQPADMDPIVAVARRHGLWVVEDAAQAHGAEYKGRKVGCLADLAAFSFYPGKNLGACGEAGAIVGRDRVVLETVRRLRDHGQSRKYLHELEGYNGRLDAIQAAILRTKLRYLPQWNEARRRVAARYREALADVPEVRLPTEAPYARHVYHIFPIRAERRDALRAHLAAHGIATGLHYPVPLHLQPAYARLGLGEGAFPVAERAAATELSLPMFPGLSEGQIERIAKAVHGFYR